MKNFGKVQWLLVIYLSCWSDGVTQLLYTRDSSIDSSSSVFSFNTYSTTVQSRFMLQVTGGSLEESKEALAIAETDGLFGHCLYPNSVPHLDHYFSELIGFSFLWSLGWLIVAVFYSWQQGFSVLLVCTQQDAKWVFVSWGLHFLPGNVYRWRCICNLYICVIAGVVCQEFDENGDPEKHFQELLSLAKKGAEKGKVCIWNFGAFSQKDLCNMSLLHESCLSMSSTVQMRSGFVNNTLIFSGTCKEYKMFSFHGVVRCFFLGMC